MTMWYYSFIFIGISTLVLGNVLDGDSFIANSLSEEALNAGDPGKALEWKYNSNEAAEALLLQGLSYHDAGQYMEAIKILTDS